MTGCFLTCFAFCRGHKGFLKCFWVCFAGICSCSFSGFISGMRDTKGKPENNPSPPVVSLWLPPPGAVLCDLQQPQLCFTEQREQRRMCLLLLLFSRSLLWCLPFLPCVGTWRIGKFCVSNGIKVHTYMAECYVCVFTQPVPGAQEEVSKQAE